MKLVSGKPYIEFDELIKSGVCKSTLKLASHRNSGSFNFIPDAEDGRKILAEYETIKPLYKEKVKSHFGCPYQYLAAQILKPLLQYLT